MDRRSWLVGFLAGGWVATLAVTSGIGPFRSARAQDPTPVPLPIPLPTPVPSTPAAPTNPNGFDPLDPTSPGRTVNPSTGSLARGVPSPGLGTAGFNNRAIALAASAGSGESVVYYFDTELARLLVYQFRPGDRGGVKLVAARHIDYDLKLEAYHDLSEKKRDELKDDYDAMLKARSAGSTELPTKKVDGSSGK